MTEGQPVDFPKTVVAWARACRRVTPFRAGRVSRAGKSENHNGENARDCYLDRA